MKWFFEVVFPFCHIFFFIFGFTGALLGILMFFSPDIVIKIEALLATKIGSEKQAPLLEEETGINKKWDLEAFFFNHHLFTGILLFLFPGWLLLFLFHLPKMQSDHILIGHSQFLFFLVHIFYPFCIWTLKIVSCISIFFGISLFLVPQYAFRVIRFLNRPFWRGDSIEKNLEKEFLFNDLFYQYSKWSGFLMMLLSTLLFVYLLLNSPFHR